MRASELQHSLPLVSRRTPAPVAARLLARSVHGSVVVADELGRPMALLTPTDVLRMFTAPDRDDVVVGDVVGRTVAPPMLRVSPDENAREIAGRMVESGTTIAVVDGTVEPTQFVTHVGVLAAMLSEDDGPER